ncbi:hypothetical protein I306_06677 [Cryptococcus gattii EJB2]|uniref:Transcription initiation factor TFIID subunit 8 n=1 Tax=Cryptococcus gattii EJB2 TaxID=1296103 RepID=A0ABR5BL18_9TREE|nr:hypothetical protein I306_06677 [Cryptococcus gattii EJB2]
MSSTTSSLQPLASPYIPPSTAPPFLRHLIVSALSSRGYDGAEAGALTEIERLVERHIEHVLEGAKDYANLCGRQNVNAGDVVMAQEDTGRRVNAMRRESKRRRRALNLQTQPSPPPSPTFTTPTLPDLLRQELSMESDQKPSISSLSTTRGESGGSGEKLSYAESWMPGLPEKWTYATPNGEYSFNLQEHVQVTSSLLDFIKLTAAERGDIPPELGLVNYRKDPGLAAGSGASTDSMSADFGNGSREERAGETVGKKRKWTVKGVESQ